MEEKVYSIGDVQNILRQEQEKWARLSRVIKVISHDPSAKVLTVMQLLQTEDGVIVEVKL